MKKFLSFFLKNSFLPIISLCGEFANGFAQPPAPIPTLEQEVPPWFSRLFVGGGLFSEITLRDTSPKFESQAIGHSFLIGQKLHESYSGLIEARWSAWRSTPESEGEHVETFPMLILSKVDSAPSILSWSPSPYLSLKPFLTIGIGWLRFYANRSPSFKKSEVGSSEFSVDIGCGLKTIINKTYNLRVSVERWRGVKTAKYHAMVYQVELIWGNADAF